MLALPRLCGGGGRVTLPGMNRVTAAISVVGLTRRDPDSLTVQDMWPFFADLHLAG